jgi:hypothetical protein
VEFLEFPSPVSPPYYAVLDSGSSSIILPEAQLRPIAGGVSGKKPSALKVDFKVEGDLVRITATVFYGEVDLSQGRPDALQNAPHETAGSYSGRLSDEIRLSQMEQAGLEPLTLKIVTARDPASVRPQAISKVPSVRFAIGGEDRTFYKLTLENLSSKTVTGYLVDMPQKNDNSIHIALGPAAIAPGATISQSFGIPYGGRTIAGKFVEDPLPPLLVLEAVLFQDSSYEGDEQVAAQMTAQRSGSDAQIARIDRLVEGLLDDAGADDTALIKRIRAAVAQLTEDPDEELLSSIRSQFPGLSAEGNAVVKQSVHIGLNSGKQQVDHQLAEYEGNVSHESVAVWWRRVKQTAQ